MQEWYLYALIAAVFIGIKDMMTKDITKRFSYIEYVIVANIFVFILTLIYIFTMRPTIKKPNVKDGFYILIRILIVLLVVEPCIFTALKTCDNPGYAKSIINLNTLVAFVLGMFILKTELNYKSMMGIALIVTGSLLIY